MQRACECVCECVCACLCMRACTGQMTHANCIQTVSLQAAVVSTDDTHKQLYEDCQDTVIGGVKTAVAYDEKAMLRSPLNVPYTRGMR